jgi:RecG-like helicase
MFGTQQSGYMAFRAIKWQDLDLLKEASSVAKRMFEEDPGLEKHGWLKEQVLRMREASHLE